MALACDVVVIGGGSIGLAIADTLLDLGNKVIVVDAQEPGRGASWAASGSLQLIVPDMAPPLLRPLAARSNALWPSFGAELEDRSQMPIELTNSGLLRLVIGNDDTRGVERTRDWLQQHDVKIDMLEGAAARDLSPYVGVETRSAYYEPKLLQVRPPRLLRALAASVKRRGGVIRAQDPVLDLIVERERTIGVRTRSETIHAAEVVLAAGSFAGELARRSLGLQLPIRPVRGQIVLLEAPGKCGGPLLLGMNGRYLIPRADGRILAGSTFENAGFDCAVTASGVRDILTDAVRLAPSLAGARIAASWAGLRPESPDRLPYLGRVSGLAGLVVAAGHFRDGLLLTPVTAEIVAATILNKKPQIDTAPFAVERRLPEWL